MHALQLLSTHHLTPLHYSTPCQARGFVSHVPWLTVGGCMLDPLRPTCVAIDAVTMCVCVCVCVCADYGSLRQSSLDGCGAWHGSTRVLVPENNGPGDWKLVMPSQHPPYPPSSPSTLYIVADQSLSTLL